MNTALAPKELPDYKIDTEETELPGKPGGRGNVRGLGLYCQLVVGVTEEMNL